MIKICTQLKNKHYQAKAYWPVDANLTDGVWADFARTQSQVTQRNDTLVSTYNWSADRQYLSTTTAINGHRFKCAIRRYRCRQGQITGQKENLSH